METSVNNKCKAFTSLEQSRKLADTLPLESADMWYVNGEGKPLSGYWNESSHDYDDIPCWSLAALLSVLPNNENISTNLSKGGYKISTLEYTNSWFVDYEDETNSLNNCVTSADNPVDTCVTMIEKLHERKLL